MEELKSKSITMHTLTTSIINAIKILRSHKKRPYELAVLEFVKKDLQTTITYFICIINIYIINIYIYIYIYIINIYIYINENLVRLTEIGIIKNNPSNNRNSYYLIDNSAVITDSQSPILTITNTPIVEKMRTSTII